MVEDRIPPGGFRYARPIGNWLNSLRDGADGNFAIVSVPLCVHLKRR